MSIGTYTELQSAVADWLMRSDLTARIPDFIHNAEAGFKRDARVRKLRTDTLTADAETKALPADFDAVDSLAHDGPEDFGELENVGLGGLTRLKGQAGVPTHYAVLDASEIQLAPVPDRAYPLAFSYWATIPHLGSSKATNWLLQERPEVYLYGTLVESAPYLRDDGRLSLWRSELEQRLEALGQSRQHDQFSGPLTMEIRNGIP